MNDRAHLLLKLLQLASPTLPVGAYSYSEGLETLVESCIIDNQNSLEIWLERELSYGAIRLETAVMLRAYDCFSSQDLQGLNYWNSWLSATKETSELRQQSWQMGNTLLRLLIDLEKSNKITKNNSLFTSLEDCAKAVGNPCNYAIAFGIGAANWQLNRKDSALAYLHSWTTNLIGAGVKLIPLGQTTGQQLLLKLGDRIAVAADKILALDNDDDLISCSWGLAMASMAHETQYTRLFRS
ncbi:MAG: urease accessory protein UreF [Prochloraceae cyanobacterium]